MQVTEEMMRKQFDKMRSEKAAGADDITKVSQWVESGAVFPSNIDREIITGIWYSARRLEAGKDNSDF